MLSNNIKKISFCAMIITMAFICSKVKIIPMPFGGSVTLFSMFIISIPGYFFGLKYGMMTAFAYSALKFVFGGYIYSPLQGILDYALSYSVFGLTGFGYKKNIVYTNFLKNLRTNIVQLNDSDDELTFNKNTFVVLYLSVVLLRWIITSISGYIFFADYTPEMWNPIIWAMVYNASYIFTEAIITILLFYIPYINKNFYILKKNFDETSHK